MKKYLSYEDYNKEVMIVAVCEDNGEVMSVTAPRGRAVRSIAKAVVARQDFMQAECVNYYRDLELSDFVDKDIMEDIAEAVRTVEVE